ncbi:MAG: hypothetical protein Ta2A_10400 [Treponemataceae bacterium]|nr:MAG: hypothetical protein Ta2A_10400 [Treponemataceae bacterium]
MSTFLGKNESAEEAETRQRQEALAARIQESGGEAKMDALEIRSIPEAVTLCKLIDAGKIKGKSMKCLENFLSDLYSEDDAANIETAVAEMNKAGLPHVAAGMGAWRGTDPKTRKSIVSKNYVKRLITAIADGGI